jgi:hypothetical protein
LCAAVIAARFTVLALSPVFASLIALSALLVTLLLALLGFLLLTLGRTLRWLLRLMLGDQNDADDSTGTVAPNHPHGSLTAAAHGASALANNRGRGAPARMYASVQTEQRHCRTVHAVAGGSHGLARRVQHGIAFPKPSGLARWMRWCA